MEQIIYLDGIITYRGSDYPYHSVEKVDDYCVHVHMGEGIYAFVGENVWGFYLCSAMCGVYYRSAPGSTRQRGYPP